MADFGSTTVSLAAKKRNLHRSSPFAMENTASDNTSSYYCGEEISPPVAQVEVEVSVLPAVPEWLIERSHTVEIDSLEPKLNLR